MANRKIKLEGGEVYLSKLPKEVCNQLEAYIAKFKVTEFVPGVPEAEEPVKSYPDKAIGMKRNAGQYTVVVVGYDSVTGEAGIEELVPAGDFESHAISVFQQEACKRRIV